MTVRRPVGTIALYGFLASGNLGNDASCDTVVAYLRRRHPEIGLVGITIAPREMAARYAIRTYALAYRPAGRLLPPPLRKVVGRAVDVPRSLWLAGRADAVVVPGMGVLEESLGVRPWGMPLWLFLMAASCRLRRRPFLLLDVGAEPVSRPLTRRLMVAAVALADHVSYRDRLSARVMREAGSHRSAEVAPDLAFGRPCAAGSRGRRPAAAAALVVGVMAYYGDTDLPERGIDAFRTYRRVLAEVLLRCLDAGDTLTLVGGDEADLPVAHELAADLRARRPAAAASVVVADHGDLADVCDVMAGAEAVIASRFHTLVAALLVGRPVVSVGYAPKNVDLMREVGLADYCQDLATLDGPRLSAQLAAVRADRTRSEDRIAERTAAYPRLVDDLIRRALCGSLGLTAPDDGGR